VLCIYSMCTCYLCNVMYRVVQIVLCEYFIHNARYRWCNVHVGYMVPCTYDALYMLYMQCYVHMVLCSCCTYGDVCITVHVVLCTCCTCGAMCR